MCVACNQIAAGGGVPVHLDASSALAPVSAGETVISTMSFDTALNDADQNIDALMKQLDRWKLCDLLVGHQRHCQLHR